MPHPVTDARGAQHGDDVVMGEMPSTRRAPYVDAAAVGDEQPRVVAGEDVLRRRTVSV